jgi:hypothetical protein
MRAMKFVDLTKLVFMLVQSWLTTQTRVLIIPAFAFQAAKSI